MAFATSAPGCLFFGLGGQQRRREAVSGAGDGGWPAGTAVVPVRSGIGLLGLGWRPIGRHRWRQGQQLAVAARNATLDDKYRMSTLKNLGTHPVLGVGFYHILTASTPPCILPGAP